MSRISSSIKFTKVYVDFHKLVNFRYFFVFGQLLHGIGGTALLNLGVTYLDDNVTQIKSSLYHGISQFILNFKVFNILVLYVLRLTAEEPANVKQTVTIICVLYYKVFNGFLNFYMYTYVQLRATEMQLILYISIVHYLFCQLTY